MTVTAHEAYQESVRAVCDAEATFMALDADAKVAWLTGQPEYADLVEAWIDDRAYQAAHRYDDEAGAA